MSPETRMSAEERRGEVLRAATAAFAEGGYKGTSTEDVAERAGISQPYIFRLFGSKRGLFIAVVEDCFRRTAATFKKAAQGLSGEDALSAMGHAYMELISDPTQLRVELHAFAAAAQDDEVRQAAQKGMRSVWEVAAEASGVEAALLRDWLARGMLCNVISALGLDKLDEPWAQEVSLLDKAHPVPAGGDRP
jgi:AcrR family transcriptional regulator